MQSISIFKTFKLKNKSYSTQIKKEEKIALHPMPADNFTSISKGTIKTKATTAFLGRIPNFAQVEV